MTNRKYEERTVNTLAMRVEAVQGSDGDVRLYLRTAEDGDVLFLGDVEVPADDQYAQLRKKHEVEIQRLRTSLKRAVRQVHRARRGRDEMGALLEDKDRLIRALREDRKDMHAALDQRDEATRKLGYAQTECEKLRVQLEKRREELTEVYARVGRLDSELAAANRGRDRATARADALSKQLQLISVLSEKHREVPRDKIQGVVWGTLTKEEDL